MKIPKRLGHIWIGPYEPPMDWMQTWRDKHPDWEWTIYDNEYLQSTSFETRAQIDEYIRRGWYAGAADLMRYEILFKNGGFLAEADSVCFHAIDELFRDNNDLYTIYENEFLRGKLVSPVLASTPGNSFLRILIDTLKEIDPHDLGIPWQTTGNKFVAEAIEIHNPKITIWPSHIMIPDHFEGRKYNGTEKIYAQQMFGSTRRIYGKSRGRKYIANSISAFFKKRYAKKIKKSQKLNRDGLFKKRS